MPHLCYITMLGVHRFVEALDYDEQIDTSLEGPKKDTRELVDMDDGFTATAAWVDLLNDIRPLISAKPQITRVMALGSAYQLARHIAPKTARPFYTYPHANEYGISNIDGNGGLMMPAQLRHIYNTHHPVDLLVVGEFSAGRASPLKIHCSEIMGFMAPLVLTPRMAVVHFPGALNHFIVGIMHIAKNYWDIKIVRAGLEIWSVWYLRDKHMGMRDIKKLLSIAAELIPAEVDLGSPLSRYTHMLDAYISTRAEILALYNHE